MEFALPVAFIASASFLYPGLPLLFNVVARGRIARMACPKCTESFGAAAARKRLAYYERLYGPGTVVFEDPCVHNGTTVVTCPHCKVEYVFTVFGRLMERFQANGSVFENPTVRD